MFLSLFRFSAGQENGDKIIDPKGIVRWEGYPLLDGFELTEKVVADILAKPIK